MNLFKVKGELFYSTSRVLEAGWMRRLVESSRIVEHWAHWVRLRWNSKQKKTQYTEPTILPRLFRAWTIMTLHNFLFLVAVRNVFVCTIPPIPILPSIRILVSYVEHCLLISSNKKQQHMIFEVSPRFEPTKNWTKIKCIWQRV